MERVVKEIEQRWHPARKTLEAERESLRAERDKFVREDRESRQGGGFSQVLKNTFSAVFPFSARNRELKRHDAGIKAKSSELLSLAKSAYASLEARALEKSRDPREDERYGSMRQVVSEIRSARLKVNKAARACREAANWTRGSSMSNEETTAHGISYYSTTAAQEALREANRSLSSLQKNLEIPSYLSFLTEHIGGINSLRSMTIAMHGNTSSTSLMGAQTAMNLENAESIMGKVSAQLDSLEAKIQGKIDSRGVEALARLRREDPDLNSLLESLSDYLSATR